MSRSFRAPGVAALVLALFATAAWAVPPPNDDISGATLIPGVPFTTTEDTREATVAPDDPECSGRSATVWYVFTPTSDVSVIAHTFGSNYDTTLSVYTGMPGSLTQLGCNDDSRGTLQSQVIFTAEAGVTYYFMVSGFDGIGGGDLVFTLEEFTPLTFDLTVDARGRVSPVDGTVTISGTVTCNKPTSVFIDVSGTQRAGRFVVQGGSFVFVTCDGVTPWSVSFQSGSGRFAAGRIQVTASGSAFSDSTGEFAQDTETRSVTLSASKAPRTP